MHSFETSGEKQFCSHASRFDLPAQQCEMRLPSVNVGRRI
jgi:hypothetical protein